MRSPNRTAPSVLVLAVLLTAIATPLCAQSRVESSDPVDFNRDIRPLLSDRCFTCHGVDAAARKAGLRLDTRDGLTTPIEGRTPVVPGDPDASELLRRITSDDPKVVMPPPDAHLELDVAERSLLRRWIAEGAPFEEHWAFLPPERPPIPTAGGDRARNPIDRFVAARLDAAGLVPAVEADRETLIRRVTLDLTGLPPTLAEIDAFLADDSADGYERLVDRLLDSPRFGERMAMMWLDVARYADTNGYHHDNVRTAWPYRDWVIDAFRNNLPYDRFVVAQLAGDLLPAADDATRERNQIASGFCRMHNINDEGGAIDAEYRVEAVADRIETVGTALMGLTMTCARCHDHKYDPITQEDYYSLFAYFNSIDERGVYPNNFEQSRAYPARITYVPDELAARIATAETESAEIERRLGEIEPRVLAERRIWETALRSHQGVRFVDARLADATTRGGAELTRLDDGSVRVEGRPESDVLTLTLETDAEALGMLMFEALSDPGFANGSVGLAPNGNAVIREIRATAISRADPSQRRPIRFTHAWADHEQPNGDFDVHNALRDDPLGWALEGHQRAGTRTALLFADAAFGFPGGTLVEVEIDCTTRYGKHVVGRPRVRLAQAALDPTPALPVVAGDWFEAGPFPAPDFDAAFETAFGPESIERLDVEQRFGERGWQHRPGIDGQIVALNGANRTWFFARALRAPEARTVELALGSDDGIRVFLDGRQVLSNPTHRGVAADQERVTLALEPGEHVVVVQVVNDAGAAGFHGRIVARDDDVGAQVPAALIPPELRDPDLDARLHRDFGTRSPSFARLDATRRAAAARLAELRGEAVPVLVMKELDAPTPTHVLSRGRYDLADTSRPVERRPPTVLTQAVPLELGDGEANDRLAFARWLTRPDHPLTARVHVNRLWQMVFGTGLLATPENFGQQADWPSHPDLLDWLATWFVDRGWDQKALLRLIVTSTTYRGAATASVAARTVDPADRLLSHFPRRRLPAESVRDLALATSGLLVERIGGPSVRPYQPDGLWREVSIGGSSNTQVFRRDAGDALYRRSLYTFWKRTSPNPQMATFDAPTREFCIVERPVTNTPLQALVLWNDVQFVEAARALATRTLDAAGTDDARTVAMFRRATGRRPDAEDTRILRDTLAAYRARFAAAPDDARRLCTVGELPRSERHDPIELAAWTMVANAILCLDETIVRD